MVVVWVMDFGTGGFFLRLYTWGEEDDDVCGDFLELGLEFSSFPFFFFSFFFMREISYM